MKLLEAIRLLQEYKKKNPAANKSAILQYFIKCHAPKKLRSIYVVPKEFAMRFSEANKPNFSNAVLSLSALAQHDPLPIVVCIVRPNTLDFRLINSTFIKKISHSSHNFTVDNVRGSFLGHDISESYEDIPNSPENFEKLLMLHREFTWAENVARLVESTGGIVPNATRFKVTADDSATILEAPSRAREIVESDEFKTKARELYEKIKSKRAELLQAAEIDNVNLRGNKIEKIITGEINAHRIDDLEYDLPLSKFQITIDIKTKLLNRSSAPKAYNIDKILRLMSKRNTAFFFLFVGLDVKSKFVKCRLVSIFDKNIIAATRIQTLWAGRSSRGVTQLSGDLSRIFEEDFANTIDVEAGKKLLTGFIERE
jgi:hypothetical protein